MMIFESEAMVFLLYGVAVAGLFLYMDYILRRWSWIPRKRHNRQYTERF